MTKEFEHYHGVVFTRLLHKSPIPLTLEVYPSKSNASYVINNRVGLFIKHSASRVAKWNFTFAKEHQDEIAEMKRRFGQVFIALVCNDDGVVLLDFVELKKVLDDNHGDSEWVKITRPKRHQYSVSGSDGKLDMKVSQKCCAEKIIEHIQAIS